MEFSPYEIACVALCRTRLALHTVQKLCVNRERSSFFEIVSIRPYTDNNGIYISSAISLPHAIYNAN